MRGTIKQRAKGSWTVILDIGRDPATGKRRQKWETVRGTKREAEKRLAELQHQLNAGTYINPVKLNLGDFLKQWLHDYASTNVRPTTAEGYRIIIEKHLVPALGNIVLSQLHPHHLQHYYSEALSKGLSARTVLHHHRVLSEALNHATRWGLVGRNIAQAVDPPRPVGKEMQVLDTKGVEILLTEAQGTMYYPLIHLALFSGLRRSELLGLRWPDIDLDAGTLTVNQVLHCVAGGAVVFQEPKTARSKRTVALSPAAVLALKAHRDRVEAHRAILETSLSPDDLVFANVTGSPMLPNTVTHAFTKIARRAGLANIRLHDLRHTHISMLIKAGVHARVIADRAGHSSISTTMDVYGHLYSETQREAAVKFELGLSVPTDALGSVTP